MSRSWCSSRQPSGTSSQKQDCMMQAGAGMESEGVGTEPDNEGGIDKVRGGSIKKANEDGKRLAPTTNNNNKNSNN
eukprot:CAMPEP_0206424074 /NCGR_PEP_ID=MMETSP0324_2-20121206/3029_1 /ASSEMBLY_ACC=CAM_ASM_000836 /TAXON_ID=2866 /ORGANISM="Crypthecodinium cohnii, Strain Seligo" /LENGTH=75 /DNA_ID=CAMNT_0053888695 /DNA_START=216 /DNA_END=441 /DNA_ORIENTATION=-